MKATLFLASCVITLSLVTQAAPLIVHEWGTFTSLQDESGRTISGINTDDEPVPKFCHDLDQMLIDRPWPVPRQLAQGVSSCHPDVTMRLETPVVYFHPPKGEPWQSIKADVKVSFHGGWLTQFFPIAEAAGATPRARNLTSESVGTLAWNGALVGPLKGHGIVPVTTERVWTAPRDVDALSVIATNGEGEKFLFYRGVGHVLCPLKASRTADNKTLVIRPQLETLAASLPSMPINALWLASFRADGTCAFRKLPPTTLAHDLGSNSAPLFSTPVEFSKKEYSKSNLEKLRVEMREALQVEGLFKDEANALLNTWEISYFKSAGMRLFFMVPRAWIDLYLPLEISTPSKISRALVGRLELVTPEHRTLLKQLADAPVPTQPWLTFVLKNNAPVLINNQFVTKGEMPPAYRDLGRFRNALLLDENETHPTPSLAAFIKLNRLEGARK